MYNYLKDAYWCAKKYRTLVESTSEKPELYIDKRDIINAKVIVKNNINK